MTRIRLALVCAALVVAQTRTAAAYDLLICGIDGTTHLGIENNTTFRLDRCTLPVGSVAEGDFQNAVNSWNAAVGVTDRFATMSGNTSCPANLEGNAHNDFLTTTSFIPSGSALAWFSGWTDGTFPGTCADGEWDVIISSSGFDTSSCNELSTTPCRRSALVHELGHVLGLAHETTHGYLANMVTFTPQPIIGGQAAGNSIQHMSGPFADDYRYGVDYHGDGTTGVDLAVSAWQRALNSGELTFAADQVISGCGGDPVVVTFTWMNKGTQAISSGSPAALNIYLSTDETIGTHDTLWASYVAWGSSGYSSTSTVLLQIPASLPLNTTYRIGVMIDPNDVIPETIDSNNGTRINRRIKRTC